MNPIFPPLTSCVLLLLQEKTDPNGKHLEYRDSQGTLFAKMTKVYKKGGLFGLFPLDNNVHAELRDASRYSSADDYLLLGRHEARVSRGHSLP